MTTDKVTDLSIARSERASNATEWTPRDMLVTLLRRIDNGEVAPDAMVICYREPVEGECSTTFLNATPDIHTAVGLLSLVKHDMMTNSW